MRAVPWRLSVKESSWRPAEGSFSPASAFAASTPSRRIGDSLQVMASLAERESLKGKVQCIYFDPPCGIKFNSNWLVSTLSRDVKDGKQADISREPEQVKAFRDTWKDNLHSYLTYLRDRPTVARDLLKDSGSIFVQIGDENVYVVRSVLEEVFGRHNDISQICILKTAGQTSRYLTGVADYVLWFAKDAERLKIHHPIKEKTLGDDISGVYRCIFDHNLRVRRLDEMGLSEYVKAHGDDGIFRLDNITSQSVGREKGEGAASWFPVKFDGREIRPSIKVRWKTNEAGMSRLLKARRVNAAANSLTYIRFLKDFRASEIGNVWADMGTGNFTEEKTYVVQTSTKIVQRCLLMASTPATSSSIPPAGPVPLLMSPSSGGGAGSPSTLVGSPWHWPARDSWLRAMPGICWRTVAKAAPRKRN
jgi:adenine-specific DNA-methyltransferase